MASDNWTANDGMWIDIGAKMWLLNESFSCTGHGYIESAKVFYVVISVNATVIILKWEDITTELISKMLMFETPNGNFHWEDCFFFFYFKCI